MFMSAGGAYRPRLTAGLQVLQADEKDIDLWWRRRHLQMERLSVTNVTTEVAQRR